MRNRRLTATLGAQVIQGVTTDLFPHTAQTLEVYIDEAFGSVKIDTTEWHVELEDFWRIIPGFSKYEMSEYGVVRNRRFKKPLRKHLHPRGGVFLVYLRDEGGRGRSRSVAKLYREIWPEMVVPLTPVVDELPCEWTAKAHKVDEEEWITEEVNCLNVGPHIIHVFKTIPGWSFMYAVNPKKEKSQVAPQPRMTTWAMFE